VFSLVTALASVFPAGPMEETRYTLSGPRLRWHVTRCGVSNSTSAGCRLPAQSPEFLVEFGAHGKNC